MQKVISQLNAAAAKFESAQADFTWDQFQAVVQEHDVQTGTIYFERKKGGTLVAAYLKQDNGKDAPKTVIFDGGEANFYEPTIKQLTVIRAGANRSQWESFLTLGFGGSGTELEDNWKVSLLGTENMDGISVAKLDLVPLQQNVANMFTPRDYLGRSNPGHQSTSRSSTSLPAIYAQPRTRTFAITCRLRPMSSNSSCRPAPTRW